jgi:hypothetical protein
MTPSKRTIKKSRFAYKLIVALSLPQKPLDLLLKQLGSLRSHQAAHFLSGCIHEDEGRLADETMVASYLLPLLGVDIDAHNRKVLTVGLLEPIHDGLHLLADRSPLGVEIEHMGALDVLQARAAACSQKTTADEQKKKDRSSSLASRS